RWPRRRALSNRTRDELRALPRTSRYRQPGGQEPGAIVAIESDMGIVVDTRRRGDEEHRSIWPRSYLRQSNELFADALTLVRLIYGKVGQISDVDEVGERSSDPHHTSVAPGRNDQVGVSEHLFDIAWIAGWAPGGQCRTFVELRGLRDVEVVSLPIFNHYSISVRCKATNPQFDGPLLSMATLCPGTIRSPAA